MHNALFYVIIGIIVAEYLFERYLDYLNTTRWSDQLPEELKGIYDEEKYKKQQAYTKENFKFGTITGALNFLITLAMFLFFGFALVNNWAYSCTTNPILVAFLFFGIMLFALDIINTPFSIYDTFVIEQKYGFNKATPKIFILDKLKGLLLGAVIGGGLLALIIWIYEKTQNLFWVFAWIVIAVFTIFMSMFYSNLIVPLFNKQTPLEDGELRDAIKTFSDKVGFKLDNIFVINGSKRSTKANAYFTGLGAKKRIVLYDTLIDDLEIPELVAVLAHEIGHYKKKHVYQGLIISLIQTGFILFLFGLLIKSPELSMALGVEKPNFHIGLIAFVTLYTPVSFVLGIFMNLLSRKNEYQADKFAADNYDAEALASSLKKLSIKNLSNLTPHPRYVYFHYSHPTLLQRLAYLKSLKKNES